MGYYQGDPVFGVLAGVAARFAPKLARKIPGIGKVVGRVGGAIGAAIGRRGKIIRTGGKIAAGGAVFEAGSRAAGRILGGEEERRRYRRMNVTNVKALRRAIRRAKGFSKLARSVLTFTSPRAPKGKVTFKTGRRK